MAGRKVSERLALAVLLAAGCMSDHRVSPWGGARSPSLAAFIPSPDLEAQLAKIDAETGQIGLTLAAEVRGKLAAGAGPVVVRAYRGRDPVGRAQHAVRAATPRGVVMAIGPAGPLDAGPDEPTELVPALVSGSGDPYTSGAFRPASDMNGDGAPEVILRSERGALAIWRLDPAGATRIAIELEVAPKRAYDADGDGKIEFAGQVEIPEGDPLAPNLRDLAIYDGVRFTSRAPGARAFHRAAAEAAVEPAAPEADADAGAPPAPPSPPEVRLRRALERAWHRILAGHDRAAALAALDREPVPPLWRASFDHFRARVARAGR
jgi:hypothetical protein